MKFLISFPFPVHQINTDTVEVELSGDVPLPGIEVIDAENNWMLSRRELQDLNNDLNTDHQVIIALLRGLVRRGMRFTFPQEDAAPPKGR